MGQFRQLTLIPDSDTDQPSAHPPGIPKFFRFMSERYPLISQLIQENRIPEFDALYLDMNGIIHNCSHPDDGNASFRITEEDIFLAVFSYITHLFSVIKPQKLFYLAVDGVAPRAKMNQQRSRRFRTAKEAKEVLDKARAKGEEIPDTEGFDSNCITPGTPFMARLSKQLKYFIAKKITEDSSWRDVEIILSGHEVPGEGEHKIMEYIRLKKAQPDYDPNVRHCLYGLDADLIMLGLLSHDPHFCLLREEVTFGPRNGKSKPKGLETQNFFLLHLSLFREYLDLEFSSLKTSKPALGFDYDLERIIDDFILLNIFVGNDFLPHLPGLHINEGAIGRLFDIYKKILPQAGGYLNEFGVLNVKRLQLVLDELTVFETEHFEHEFADSNWFKGKQTKHIDAMEKARARNKLVITKAQRKLFKLVHNFVHAHLFSPEGLASAPNARLTLPNTLSARDRRFLSDLGDELRLVVAYDEYDEDGQNVVALSFDAELLRMAQEDEDEEGSSDEEESGEWKGAIERVLKKYEKAETAKDFDEEDQEASYSKQLEEKMTTWKNDYYREKLEFKFEDKEALHDLAYRYIEGLQWVLHYYYSGVASWGWFYNYHYAPKISDLKEASTYEFNFELGKPFHPFEQLMGVLPDLSSSHIPAAFRDLMSDPASPIIDFYPTNFVQDLNGKKQDWEAIVKIPFIDEKRLLATMAARAPRLTAEERARNEFGDSWKFTYDETVEQTYPSSMPGFFPDILHCRCRLEPFQLPTLEGGLSYIHDLVPGALLGKDAVSGFPSLYTIPFTGQLGFHGVSVFQGDSKKETMVVTTDNIYDGIKSEDLAKLVVGQKTFTGYPYLQEGLVVAVSDSLFRYELETFGKGQTRVRSTPHSPATVMQWKRSADKLEYVYSKRYGCIIGGVEVVVHAKPLKGLMRMDDGSSIKEYEDKEQEFAIQATVQKVSSEDVRFVEQAALPVDLEFPEGCKVFFLGAPAFGVPAQVVGHEGDSLTIRIAFFPSDKAENLAFRNRMMMTAQTVFTPAHAVGRILQMSGLALAKITSSLMISQGDSKINIGLNLKFEAKGLKVLGYSQKGDTNQWEFSEKAINLIRDYVAAFPEIAGTLERKKGDLTSASDFFPAHTVEARVKDLKAWLVEKGVRDLEKVPLYSEQLEKETVRSLEALSDHLSSKKDMSTLKQAAIKNIPRSALLKPAHTAARLREQTFQLGDRVVLVSDTGSVPLSAKGVVVGIVTGFVDVVWDVQFIGGTTLGDRCSQYRGATVAPSAILNLTNQQYITGTQPPAPAPVAPTRGRGAPLFARGPRGGPAILPGSGGLPAGGFHPAPQQHTNGARGRGGPNGIQVLRNPARTPAQFNGNYGGAARGELPAPAAAPAVNNHTAALGAALGMRGAPRGRGAAAPNVPTNGHGGRGGVPSVATNGHGGRGAYHSLAHPAPEFTAAQRGGRGAIRGAVSLGGGVAIPPPAEMNQPAARGRGRGRGAPAPRGGRGRGASGAPAVAT